MDSPINRAEYEALLLAPLAPYRPDDAPKHMVRDVVAEVAGLFAALAARVEVLENSHPAACPHDCSYCANPDQPMCMPQPRIIEITRSDLRSDVEKVADPKPMPKWQPVGPKPAQPCGAKDAFSPRRCTKEAGHEGNHEDARFDDGAVKYEQPKLAQPPAMAGEVQTPGEITEDLDAVICATLSPSSAETVRRSALRDQRAAVESARAPLLAEIARLDSLVNSQATQLAQAGLEHAELAERYGSCKVRLADAVEEAAANAQAAAELAELRALAAEKSLCLDGFCTSPSCDRFRTLLGLTKAGG